MGAPRGWRNRLGTALAWLAAVCAVLVLLGSCEYRTTRVWGPDPVDGTSGTIMTEGYGRWAAWTLLCGLAALITLGVTALIAVGRRRAALTALAAVPFAVAAALAGRHWLRLLEEQERERAYALSIAIGLPVVTIAGAAGVGLALLLTGVSLPGSQDRGSDTAE